MAAEAEEVSRDAGTFGLIEASAVLLTCDPPLRRLTDLSFHRRQKLHPLWVLFGPAKGHLEVNVSLSIAIVFADKICGIPPHGESPSPSKSMITNQGRK